MRISRRSLLAVASLTSAAPASAWAQQSLSRGTFTHGVASGDPWSDNVILWTRFVSAEEGRVGWEIAEDDAFARVAARGVAQARFANDFCVKVEAGGLEPGRRYFYRFLSASGPSETGRTRTAPHDGAESLSIAVFSCANFAFGYFHAYAHAAARDDIDLVVHTGDYIYEMQRGAYPSAAEAVAGRVIDPVTETVTLSDYYQRYATYHTDPGLLELRRTKPMTAVWDDHEIANDAWREHAQAHHTPTEGAYLDRVAAAAKAYFDWLPIRRPDPRTLRLYRHLDWGGLARIVLLDTRFVGRDRQLDYRTELLPRLAQGGADAAAITAEYRANVLDDPSRSLLGAVQEDWFNDTLAQSKQRGQTWQIVAQQVIVGGPRAAPGMTRMLPDSASPGTRAWFTSAEQVGAYGLPWNLDAWGGYPIARARFVQSCATNASNAVVLAGDSHNCWLYDLPTNNRLAAIEFATGSVSSPGFERSLAAAAPGEREALFRGADENLAWCDLSHRGYGMLRFTRAECTAEWVAVTDERVAHAGAATVSRMHSAPSANAGPGGWSA